MLCKQASFSSVPYPNWHEGKACVMDKSPLVLSKISWITYRWFNFDLKSWSWSKYCSNSGGSDNICIIITTFNNKQLTWVCTEYILHASYSLYVLTHLIIVAILWGYELLFLHVTSSGTKKLSKQLKITQIVSNGACIQTQVSVTTIECNSFKFFWVQNGQREGKRKEVKF